MDKISDEFAMLLDTVSKVSADLACDLLKDAGIPALQHGPDFDVAELGAAAHDALRGVSVFVPKRALEKARAVLAEAWDDFPAS